MLRFLSYFKYFWWYFLEIRRQDITFHLYCSTESFQWVIKCDLVDFIMHSSLINTLKKSKLSHQRVTAHKWPIWCQNFSMWYHTDQKNIIPWKAILPIAYIKIIPISYNGIENSNKKCHCYCLIGYLALQFSLIVICTWQSPISKNSIHHLPSVMY